MEKRKIYILLTYSGTVLSRLIKLITKEPYSHVSVSLDEDLEELYSFGRKRPSNPLFAGFVKEDVVNGTYARFPKTKCALYSIEISEGNYKKILKQLKKFKKEKNKYKYNLMGLINFFIKIPIENEYSYFCSEFVSEILNNSGIKLIDKAPNLTAPGDFRRCESLELVYEGDLKKYNSSNPELRKGAII